MIHWKDRFLASGIHFGISLVFALLAGLLVFGVWYPYPYREISGGRELFLILVTVDVILGPLITLAIFNRAKPVKVLKRDLAVVGMIQLAALGYGLWTVAAARPVHLVFEIYRFRAVHAADVPQDMLKKAPPGLALMPMSGPTLLSVRPFKNDNERMDATLTDLGGLPIGARPDFWQSYEAGKAQVIASAKPVSEIRARLPAQAAVIDEAVASTGRKAEDLGYVPLVGRKNFWTVLIDRQTAQVLAFVPVDPF
ncbi:MAG: pilus assembly protein [Comamonadaceae bacterium]|nr:MAG: pilus assembly protein [Comamonadaceae bacterium]